MRSFIKSVFLWAAVICILPAAAAGGAREDRQVTVPAAQSVILPEERTLRLLCESTGEITETDMEEYAVFAVLEEVPFIPDDEALKAQVCAARTYAARRILSGENESGAHISDDCSRYQTALSEADARAIYGGDYDTALSAVRAAAKETEGEIIMYGNAPAIAAFHISSAGKTESAESVWGKAYPYLISVPSDCTEVRREFTKAEIAAR
ncbi:MAG: SpoIID/LytB domain-containing protein, partial [Huintestinicola sp.]